MKGHIPALDGLRGLAILLVMFDHISVHFHYHSAAAKVVQNLVFGGYTGVDLFFVLSGFLITGILWDTRGGEHYFRNFYARRTLRIFPLYYAALTFLLFVIPAFAPIIGHLPARLHDIAKDRIEGFAIARAYWPLFYTYLANVLVAWKGFGIWLTYFWSLSVEEHFYLAWPLVVYCLNLRALMIASIGLVIGTMVLRVAALPLISADSIYALTPFRVDGLALGALLALLWRAPEHRLRVQQWANIVMPITGLFMLGIFYCKGPDSPVSPLSQSIGYTATILFYGSLLVRVLDTEGLNRLFRNGVLRLFGKYSYSIYIFHLIIAVSLETLFALGNVTHPSIVARVLMHFSGGQQIPLPDAMLWPDGIVYIVLVLAVSLGTAWVTWHLIEAPCLRLKHFFSYEEKGKSVEGAEIVADLAHR